MAARRNHILIGVLDEKISATLTVPFHINRVGGKTDSIELNLAGNTTCQLCNICQTLVAQIYCPLDNSPHHRLLCIFSCVRSSCWSKKEGWSILRVLVRDKKNTEQKKKIKFEETWGDDDDWGDDIDLSCNSDVKNIAAGTNVVSENFNQLTISSDQEKSSSNQIKNVNFVQPPVEFILPSYYINVFDETDCEKPLQLSDKDAKNNVQLPDDSKQYVDFVGDECKLKPETYERTEHEDETFYKFWKIIQKCPEQIIRYWHGGNPLFARKHEGKIPHCLECGAPRVYEMQLMPALLPCLSTQQFSIEFSTVLIYTCSKDCSNDSGICVKREYLIFQDDPDLSYFKGQKQ